MPGGQPTGDPSGKPAGNRTQCMHDRRHFLMTPFYEQIEQVARIRGHAGMALAMRGHAGMVLAMSGHACVALGP
ncbi:unnamed protein product [Toxocara canis]|uniref:AraC family transcriptional regulator n=1 Tax=Toxocara canis TaxID=6265 RepID=A0A183V1Y4_TOXCA|nr:unnamed protein product [Toxocara canis]